MDSFNQEMAFIRANAAAAVSASVLNKGIVSATRLVRDRPDFGLTVPHLIEDALMIAVQQCDYSGDLFLEDRHVDFPISRAGTFSFYDLRQHWQADMRTAFDCVNFHIPRSAISAVEEDFNGISFETLNVAPGENVDDPLIFGLTTALAPAFRNPDHVSRLFLDHLSVALLTHLGERYGQASAVAVRSGGLAPWQEKRAKEMMDADPAGEFSLIDVAASVHLSPGYFSRAFKVSTGMSPYQWALKRRLEKAAELLLHTDMSIAAIARSAGFSDQAHLTRLFPKSFGQTPATWRRQRRATDARIASGG